MSVADNLKLGCFLLRGARAIADRTEQVLGWSPILRERARQRAHA